MQYHLNGFKPGNYQVSEAVRNPHQPEMINDLPSKVDVLIVGCGPAGLILARQLAEFSDIKTCIVDKKKGPMLFGQADGISCRTMEIMESFNSSERLVKEAYQLHQNSFWESLENGEIKRIYKMADSRLGLSEFIHSVVNQARLHDILLEEMKNSPAQLTPCYGQELLDIEFDETILDDLNHYPIKAIFQSCNHEQTKTKVKAKFIVGCDGARSNVRKSLSIELQGDSTNKAWGVMDILLDTDFPDIRVKTFIQSTNVGSLMIVPREGGYLARFYVELFVLEQNQRAKDLDIKVEDLIRKAQLIMKPYHIEVKEVAWWSIYEVGQRVANSFDYSLSVETFPRAFIAGDACHTHSPKGGWGLNTSVADTFNLGWKLVSVIKGLSHPKLLHTYSFERKKVAQQLIEADKKMSSIIASGEVSRRQMYSPDYSNTDVAKFVTKQSGFIAGTSIRYEQSIISNDSEFQSLANGFQIGERFHSEEAIRLCDGRPLHLGHNVKADGRWRLFIFNNYEDPTNLSSKYYKLMKFLMLSPNSPIERFTGKKEDKDSVFDIYSIFQQPDIQVESIPKFIFVKKGIYKLTDYEKLFYITEDKDIYKQRCIDKSEGCIVIVRPDQHIGDVLSLSSYSRLSGFFEAFMFKK